MHLTVHKVLYVFHTPNPYYSNRKYFVESFVDVNEWMQYKLKLLASFHGFKNENINVKDYLVNPLRISCNGE